MPSPTCYDAVGNIHKSFVFTQQAELGSKVIFLIQALDNCEFTLSLINENTEFIKLEDSQPFAYQLNELEEEMKFTFDREIQADVTFNLVSPFHSLDLIVENREKMSRSL